MSINVEGLLADLKSRPPAPAVNTQPAHDFTKQLEFKGNAAEVTLRDKPGAVNEGTARTFLEDEGLNPDDFEVTGFSKSEWGNSDNPMESVKFQFKKVGHGGSVTLPDLDDLHQAIRKAAPLSIIEPDMGGLDRTVLTILADAQVGKTDTRGGTEDLLHRTEASRLKWIKYLEEHKPAEVILVDAGDCFTGDTEIVTREGIFPIGDLVGREVEVKDGKGHWVRVPIKPYGKKPITEVTWRFKRATKVTRSSEGHLWILSDGRKVRADELRPGDKAVKGYAGSNSWSVEAIVATGEYEETFCCEVPSTQSFHLADGLLTSNCIENFESTAQQDRTNDLQLTEQIRVWRRIFWTWIETASTYCESVKVVGVPSNHGRVRRGKANMGPPADDFGIEVLAQVADMASVHPERFGHVQFFSPEDFQETVAIQAKGGKVIGVAHGHQVARPEKFPDWLAGQALGRTPISLADIFVFGHFHNLRVQTVGDDRWLFIAPTSDSGSSWFTNLSGNDSAPGVMSIVVEPDGWRALDVH